MASASAQPRPHPLAPLSEAEHIAARDAIAKLHGPAASILFRAIHLNEPSKAELLPFLEAEHAGALTEEARRPARLALVEHDVLVPGRSDIVSAVVDVGAGAGTGDVLSTAVADAHSQPYYTPGEFRQFQEACLRSDMFKEAMSEFTLPEGFSVCIDPWPYGGPDSSETLPRTMQGLVFAKNASSKNDDANHYAYPIPIIPIMDLHTKNVVRVERLATGGIEDGLEPGPRSDTPRRLFDTSAAADYVPELLGLPLRQDLKPLDLVQPAGASFTVCPDGLVEWQKWRFRLGITPREGAALHDVCYHGRPVLYRLSFSEMTVPYGDPRPPFQRKQAFDFGDGGMGRAANNLELGCDCLGAIHYVDALLTKPDGSPSPGKAVVCLHEQDNGVLWKHTNFRTSRAVVTRNRELVVQSIATLANYEYVFAYKLDLAGGITLEVRATGIMSVVGIDHGKTSAYGNVVAPGILAQNHQHIFAVRIDPAIGSYKASDGQVVVEETHGRRTDPRTNPYGNLFEIQRKTVDRAAWIDAEPRLNRLIKLENAAEQNAISGKNLAYKLIAPATQTLLADPESAMARRAQFAQHHTWVTGHRDGELWAAGEFTNQSRREVGGVADMVRRGDWFTDGAEKEAATDDGEESTGGRRSSPVVWSVFGLTHNPRTEDWPVMPVEIHQIHLRPADFFTENPALDVPSTKNEASVLVSSCCSVGNATQDETAETRAPIQEYPAAHLQGGGPDVDARAAGAHVEGDESGGG